VLAGWQEGVQPLSVRQDLLSQAATRMLDVSGAAAPRAVAAR
jgi:hypothetical protein